MWDLQKPTKKTKEENFLNEAEAGESIPTRTFHLVLPLSSWFPYVISFRGPSSERTRRERVRISWAQFFCVVWLIGGAGIGCRAPQAGRVEMPAGGEAVRCEGQAVWKPSPSAPGWAGELTVVLNERAGFDWVEFSKGPVILFRFERSGSVARLDAPLRKSSRRADGRNAQSWMAWQLLAGVAGKPSSEGWIWKQEDGDRFLLEHPQTGESLRGYLSKP